MRFASPAQFRRLLGHFATGVTVATALDEQGTASGMTATAVAAVSLEPPLLLLCVNHGDPFHQALCAARTFAINVLARDQEMLSKRFAGDAATRFQDVRYSRGPQDLPLLEGVVAHIICEQWQAIPAGDHTIFIGRVLDGTVFPRLPLLHFQGGYTSLDDWPGP